MNDKKRERALPSLVGFLKGNKRLALILLLLLLGLILVFMPSLTGGADEAEADELEARLEQMCSSLSGVGSCRVMVTYKVSEARYGQSATKTVESVAVVCKGADRIGVRKELTDMLSSLFGIGTNRIHIAKMK